MASACQALRGIPPARSPFCTRPVIAAFLFATASLISGCGSNGQPEDTSVAVRSMVLEPSDQTQASPSTAYAGTISSSFESDLAFRVPGRIVSRLAGVGDIVGRGERLAVLDAAPFRTATRSAEAAVAAARAEFNQAQDDVVRNAPLADDKIIAAADMARLRSQRDAAAARLREAQERASGARDELGYTVLSSPVEGVVTRVSAEVGQYLAPGQIMFRIARPGALDAVVDVPERAIASLRVGQSAKVQLAAVNDQWLQGTVREISPAADPATRTYRVKVALKSVQTARIGMTSRVSFDPVSAPGSSAQQSVFRIPRSAIRQDDKRQPAVWIIAEKGKISLRPVKLGKIIDTDIVVIEGLRRGERIVTAGVNRLDAGQTVRVWDGRLP